MPDIVEEAVAGFVTAAVAQRRLARNEESGLVIPNKRRMTWPDASGRPALRVQSSSAPYGVANLAKGTTIGCASRLVWHTAGLNGSDKTGNGPLQERHA